MRHDPREVPVPPARRLWLGGGLLDNGLVAYDEHLAERVRELVAVHAGLTEQRMFGGLAFLIGGHRSGSVSGGIA